MRSISGCVALLLVASASRAFQVPPQNADDRSTNEISKKATRRAKRYRTRLAF
ncbi:MAG TPA: hypothetical protein VMT15_14655 [Bryobacteraceae bacterium]|nr:hypothetical protein [Bryobacteraceae bacterium]